MLALAVLFLLAAYLFQPKDDSALRARIAQLEGQLDAAKHQAAHARQAADKSAQLVNTRHADVRKRDAVLVAVLDSAKTAANDTAVDADSLRVALVKTVEQAEMYRQEVLRYQASVDTLLIAHVRERQHGERQVRLMQAMIDEQAAALTPCTYFKVRCPTRAQSFVVGFAFAIAVIVLL